LGFWGVKREFRTFWTMALGFTQRREDAEGIFFRVALYHWSLSTQGFIFNKARGTPWDFGVSSGNFALSGPWLLGFTQRREDAEGIFFRVAHYYLEFEYAGLYFQ
jgi:hypothetical protein